MESRREYGIDMIKVLAVIFVVGVHFFLNTDFYNINLTQKYLHISLRWLLFSCVPLFLLCSGYLQKNKKYDLKYLLSGIRIFINYLGISIICYIFRVCYLNENISLLAGITKVFNFTMNGYGWYMGMFFGLYALMPAINAMYFSQKKKNKLIIIFIFTLLTSIPNNYILSTFWLNLYPITYYLIGLYICEYKPKINKIVCIMMVFIVVILETYLTILLIDTSWYTGNLFFDNYGNLFTMLISICIFILFYDMKISGFLEKILIEFSNLTMQIYMFSFIFDIYIYQKMKLINPLIPGKYIFIVVPIIFLLSYFSAYIFETINYYLIYDKGVLNGKKWKFKE